MGRIQSIQSFSTLDGPGTRCVVFFQGCPVGCIFCHNPDSWEMEAGEELNVEELLRKLDRFRPFLRSSGLTLSGGEPLAQPGFALELIKQARAEGWHVALDTSGWGSQERFGEVVQEVDLVLFSVKHPLRPEQVSRCQVEKVNLNLQLLAGLAVPIWLRYVLIPGWTDQPEALQALGELASQLPNLQKLEILPYNGLAESKWQKLQWDSPIFHDEIGVSEEQLREAEQQIAQHLGNNRSALIMEKLSLLPKRAQ